MMNLVKNTRFARPLGVLAVLALSASAVAMAPLAVRAAGDPAKAAPVATSDNPVVAKVNGKEVHLSDLKAFMKTLPEQMQAAPLDQVFPMVQEQVVVGELISEQAAKENLANDPEVQARLASLKDNVIRATYMERKIKQLVTDDVLKKAYDSFVSEYKPSDEVKAQHILVSDEATAKDIIAQLDKGAKFDDLVKKYSSDKGEKNDGDLGYFKQNDMVKEFADAAFALKKGTYSKTPVKTQFGYHIILVNDRRAGKAPTFEELKPQLRAKAQHDLVEQVLGSLRKDAKIELFDAKGAPLASEATKAPVAAPAKK